MQPHLAQPGYGFTGCLSSAGLAEGTTAATIKTAAPNGAGIDYAIDGLAFHKADTDNIAFTAAAAQPVLTTCLYLVQIDANGNVSTKKGAAADKGEVLTSELVAGRDVLLWPQPDANKCALGAVKVALAGAATFTAGTTDLSAASVTATYYNFALTMPGKGLVL